MLFLKEIFGFCRVHRCGAGRNALNSIGFWIICLTLINLTLLTGGGPHVALLLQDCPSWWQWVTHPLMHLSPYHLLLDGLAFLTLWTMLPKGVSRWMIYGIVSLGSGLAAMLDPNFTTVYGFGGLSGVGHGLMAYLLVSLLIAGNSKAEKWLYFLGLAVLISKSLLEVYSGHVVLASYHIGDLGTPLVYCHLGGTLSGLLCAFVRLNSTGHKATIIKA